MSLSAVTQEAPRSMPGRSFSFRTRLVLLLAATVVAFSVGTAVASADFGFVPGTFSMQGCTDPTDPTCAVADNQAGAHPGALVTQFSVNTTSIGGVEVPDAEAADLEVTLAAGVTANPQAVPQCTDSEFGFSTKKAGLVGACPADTQVGVLDADVYSGSIVGGGEDEPIVVPIYNVTPDPGQAATFGGVLPFGNGPLKIEGGLNPATDSEDVTINNLPAGLALIDESLVLWGAPQEQNACAPSNPNPPATDSEDGTPNCPSTTADEAFITNPPSCGPVTQPATISADAYVDPDATATAHDEATAARTSWVSTSYTPVAQTGCAAEPTAASTLSVSPIDATDTVQGSVPADSPTGLLVGLTFSQDSSPADLATSPLQNASVTLPVGFSINPAAGSTIEACTDAQFGLNTSNPITCPDSSEVGNVALTSPDLPGALTGSVYLGSQQPGDPFRIFIDASSPSAGVDIRLTGSISSDPSNGQLTTTLSNLPQLQVSSFQLAFSGSLAGGASDVLASPLDCGTGTVQTSLAPWSGGTAAAPGATLTTDADGKGGACPKQLPFTPSTAVVPQTTQAGAFSPLTVAFTRAPQQPFLSGVSVVLPPGLTGLISSVPLCSSADAAAGTCPASSQVGSATVAAGVGPNPVSVSGSVYLAGPYTANGVTYPFSLSIVVPVAVGPFNFGTEIEQAGISVDPTDAHLTTVTTLPTMQSFVVGPNASYPPASCPANTTAGCQGLLLRIRSVVLSLNRTGFILNPTSCAVLSGSSTLSGVDAVAATAASLTAPLSAQFAGCAALPFSPVLTVTAPSATAATSGTTGAGVDIKLTQSPGQSDLKTVAITLPSAFSARLTTVSGACPAATYAANSASCPASSQVGTAVAVTPLLPGSLTGTAYLVSSASVGLPNIDVVLHDDGVTFNLSVAIALTANGLVSSLTSPDVPISSFDLDLPPGPHSALAATKSLCSGTLSAPATLNAQTGAQLKLTPVIKVTGCPVVSSIKLVRVPVLRHAYKQGVLKLSVKAPAAGRLSVSGSGTSLHKVVYDHVSKASTVTLSAKLSRIGLARLRKHHQLKLILRVGFLPTSHQLSTAKTYVTINLRS